MLRLFERVLCRVFGGHPRWLAGFVLLVAVTGWTLAGWLAWFTWDVTMRLPDRSAMREIAEMAQATTIFDIKRRPVFTIFKEQRIEVPLEQVSPNLIRAVLSIEDQRFYEHRGVDFVRVIAAAVANLRSGRAAQGGSTITQQLARQNFLSRDKTLRRKLKEVLLAARIEHSYGKQDILELYLNKIYFGDGFYGVEAASLGYFAKHAAEVSVEEAALLAGLIQSPSAYAPRSNLPRATSRRNLVLAAMLENRAISRSEYERARDAPVTLTNGLRREEDFGLYFKEQVRRELVERFGWERVSLGGLRVYTSIDADLQRSVEQSVERALQRIEARPGYRHPSRAKLPAPSGEQPTEYLQGAVVVMDAATGEVRALVGGRSFEESRFNRAVQAKRQPGSAFKPFVFAAALENGFTPATVLTRLDDPVLTAEGQWMPEDEHSGAASMTLRTALRTSSNRAAVALLRQVGIDRTLQYLDRLKIGTVPGVMSLALGAGEVTLLNMTAAYGAFADGGQVRTPIFIRRVEDAEGVTLAEARVTDTRAISESTAFLLANMLADVVNAGTGYRARQSGFQLPAAGKTGTTNDYHDAWFVGFTPKVVAGVWIGFDQPQTIISNGYAGELAVPLWADIMKLSTRGDQSAWLKKPESVVGVEICRMSGLLPSDGCRAVEILNDRGETEVRSTVYWEYFLRGTQPTGVCDLHPGVSVLDRIAGFFGNDVRPDPVPAEEAGLPGSRVDPDADEVGDTAAGIGTDETAARGQAPRKRRGFWARVFGIGDEDDRKDDRQKQNERQRAREPRPPER